MKTFAFPFLRTPAIALACALAFAGAASAQQPNQAVLDAATQKKEETLKLLERLVNIDSGSTNAEGLEKVRTLVVDELRQLGARMSAARPPVRQPQQRQPQQLLALPAASLKPHS